MFKMVFAKLDLMTHEILYFGMGFPSYLVRCLRQHNLTNCDLLDVVGSKIYQAARIRYVVKGDDPDHDVIDIPGFAVFFLRKTDGGRLKLYRAETYLNPTEVFSRIAEKGL